MSKARQWIAATVTFLLCTPIAVAKPDFSGEWKMNPAKSDFGAMPAPTSMLQKVTHNEPELKVVSSQVGERGEFTSEASYTTDGKECINRTRMGERKSTLRWDGDMLVIESKMDFQGNALTIADKWTLSEDGKTLTINRLFSSSMGEGEATIVLEKQ